MLKLFIGLLNFFHKIGEQRRHLIRGAVGGPGFEGAELNVIANLRRLDLVQRKVDRFGFDQRARGGRSGGVLNGGQPAGVQIRGDLVEQGFPKITVEV